MSSLSGPNEGSFVNRPATLEMGGGPLNLRISPFKSSSNCVYTSASLARRRSSCVTANLANLNKENYKESNYIILYFYLQGFLKREIMFFGAYFMHLKASNLGPRKYLSISNFLIFFIWRSPPSRIKVVNYGLNSRLLFKKNR